jgi:hypothetical protein
MKKFELPSITALLAACTVALPLSAAALQDNTNHDNLGTQPAFIVATPVQPSPTRGPQPLSFPSSGLSMPTGLPTAVPAGAPLDPQGTTALPAPLSQARLAAATPAPLPTAGAPLVVQHGAAHAHPRRHARRDAAALRARLKASADGSGPALSAPDKAVLEGRLKTPAAPGGKSGQ